ncbi:uncharacterized protein LOC124126274 [Haliotis rufescens]|uniref:uncharacterized protein LOC124126274 n=1 Tax=Haliotis rufescens TaxID=6454 RepID=UPI001EB050DE|nr:uncharacterized protein LOC124126274 [Haliotis rufescens]
MMWAANLAVICLVLVRQSYSKLLLEGFKSEDASPAWIYLHCSKDGWTPQISFYWKLNNTIVFRTNWFHAYISDSSFMGKVRMYTGWRDHYVNISEPADTAISSKWRCGDNDDDEEEEEDWSNEVCLSDGGTMTKTVMPVKGNITFEVKPEEIFEGRNLTMSCILDAENATRLSQTEDFEVIWIRNDTMFAVTFHNGTLLLVNPYDNNRTTILHHHVSVNSSEHSITMVARPHLQSTWYCGNHLVEQPSNTVSIIVRAAGDSTTTSPLPGSLDTDSPVLYIAIGCTVVVVVIAVAILVVAVQKKRQANRLEGSNKTVAESSSAPNRRGKIEMEDNILYEQSAIDKASNGSEKVMMENTLYVSADDEGDNAVTGYTAV